MSGESAPPAAQAETGAYVDFLQFSLAGTPYALELGRIGQVVRRPTISRVPRSPATVRGATAVEGDVTVAVDPYVALELERPFIDDDAGVLVVLDPAETPQPIGLLVEAVGGIERNAVESVVPADATDERPLKAWLDPENDSRIPVLDVHGLLAEVRT